MYISAYPSKKTPNRPMKILVITPVTRPDNLLAIYNSLAANSTACEIAWHLIFDLSIKDQLRMWEDRLQANGTRQVKVHFYISNRAYAVGGHYHRNHLLNVIQDKAKTSEGLSDAWLH